MYSGADDPRRAGFPHSEIRGSAPICRLPAAYRRLSRPSSPVIAKASTACTYSLDPITLPPVARPSSHRASLISACARLPPFSIRQAHDAIHNPVCAGARQPNGATTPPTHHLHNSRIFKDQPIWCFMKKPEGKPVPHSPLFCLLFFFRPPPCRAPAPAVRQHLPCASTCRAPAPGGANRDRTGDLLLAKQALSQLSYGPRDPLFIAAPPPRPSR